MKPTHVLVALLNLCLLGTIVSRATGLPDLDSLSPYAPISAASAGPAVSRPPGYRLEYVGDGAYMITDGLYQAMFLFSCESVIVVDSPPLIGYAKNVTIEKWKGKLAGLDVYGLSNAAAMLEALLIDWGINGAFGVSNAPVQGH
ncbi:hypothetical protein LTR17_016986 [Elasticomyces elasticus]|nr:hypothetical protein LTR17_016986 [Elasticomyces elasticus]